MTLTSRARRVRGWLLLGAYGACLAWGLHRWGAPSTAAKTTVTLTPGTVPAPAADGTIAVVDLKGPIALSMGGAGRGSESVLRRLREIREDPSVRAVVLRINSPGGTVASVQEIHAAVLSVKASGKKVVASFEDLAASGGYYVAVAADRIVANPGTLVGSIGVIFKLYNTEELAKKVGVRFEVFKSGALKDLGSGSRPLSEEERRVFNGLVQSAYGQFLTAVSEGRKMPIQRLKPLADGRVFTGEQALAVGLVDVLGGFDRAVEEARSLAGLKAAKPKLIYSEKPWARFMELLQESLAGPWARLERWTGPRAALEYVWD